MKAAKVDPSRPGVLALSGDLLFKTVMPLRAELDQLLARQSDACVLDFSAVGRVDSAALSLWLSCKRLAQRRGLELRATGLPAELESIAALVGLDQLSQ